MLAKGDAVLMTSNTPRFSSPCLVFLLLILFGGSGFVFCTDLGGVKQVDVAVDGIFMETRRSLLPGDSSVNGPVDGIFMEMRRSLLPGDSPVDRSVDGIFMETRRSLPYGVIRVMASLSMRRSVNAGVVEDAGQNGIQSVIVDDRAMTITVSMIFLNYIFEYPQPGLCQNPKIFKKHYTQNTIRNSASFLPGEMLSS